MDGEQLIKTIDQSYYRDEADFNLDHLTEQLPENLTSDYLLDYKSKLERLLSVVTRKVSELVLSHQPAYVSELERIADLQKSITESIRVCSQGRRCLRFIKDGTAMHGSTIVHHHQKRESLTRLLKSLTAINELKRSVIEIRSLIDNQENFPRAIQMCKDGKAMLASFDKYKCVNDLGSKLNDTIELIGEQVDTVLAKMCLNYDADTYLKLHTAYVLMDRSEIAVDQLLMHFCSSINSQAHSIVIKYLIRASETNVTPTKSDTEKQQIGEETTKAKFKKDFQELCKMLTSEDYLNCLIELCRTYWVIMMNYTRILRWHQVELVGENCDETIETLLEGGHLLSTSETNQEEFKRLYIERKLIGGLYRLWYDMKRKLSPLILSHDFSSYRFDEFIQVLRVIDLMIRVGDEFCGCPLSEDLISCINTQALNFFNAYHSSSVEELKMFIENEIWEMLPVKSDFKLVQLKEFSFLRNQTSPLTTNEFASTNSDQECERIFSQEQLNENKQSTTSPFDKILQADKDTGEDLFGRSPESQHQQEGSSYFDQDDALPLDRISLSSDSESELAKEYVDEEGNDDLPEIETSTQTPTTTTTTNHLRLTKHSGPVLTNSSLNVLRLAGRYVQMMNVLSPISFEILMKIYKLLDHYTAFVYKRFAPDNDKNLNSVINSLRESLIGNNQTNIEDATSSLLSNNNNRSQQVADITTTTNSTNQLNHQANKEQSASMNSQKAVAVESLIFLVNQLWNLQEYLESLISAEQRARLREQFSQNCSMIPDFLKARADMTASKQPR